MTRRTVFIALSIVTGIIVSYAVISNGQERRNRVSAEPLAGSIKSEGSYQKDVEKLNRYWSHIHAAREYLNVHDYEGSRLEYEAAISASRSDGDVWMARALLKDLYEKSLKYDAALREIEWLMNNNNRADVLAQLSIERESLLAAKAQQGATAQ